MNLFHFFQPAATAPIARERLQILLEYERKLGSQIDLFAVLREEILAVVSRHVSVDPERVQVTVDRGPKFSTLAVDIEIPNTGSKGRGPRVPSAGGQLVTAMRQIEDARPGRNLGDVAE
jgi:cell division topological specificity factor